MKNVKNLLILVFSLLASINMYAQIDIIAPNMNTNVNGQSCFCCNGYYAFPTPNVTITGPTSVSCGQKPQYCIKPCPGATVLWTVSAPNSIASGQGTNCVTLNPTTSSSVTISVKISCGDKSITNKIIVPIKQIENCKPDFLISLQELANGYQVHGNQTPAPNTIHFWQLDMVADCPNGATLNNVGWLWINPPSAPSASNPAITAGPTGLGFQYSGLVKGKCYRLYHFVYCCGKWIRSYKCFCLSTGRMATDMKALNENSVTKEVTVEELPAELRARLLNNDRR